jgi:hypothetical protein
VRVVIRRFGFVLLVALVVGGGLLLIPKDLEGTNGDTRPFCSSPPVDDYTFPPGCHGGTRGFPGVSVEVAGLAFILVLVIGSSLVLTRRARLKDRQVE